MNTDEDRCDGIKFFVFHRRLSAFIGGFVRHNGSVRHLFLAAMFSIGALAANPAIRDIDGRELNPLHPRGAAEILFFVASDCPISNFYAPEIQRICAEYAGRQVSCALVYTDAQTDTAAIRKHLNDFGYRGIPAILDDTRTLTSVTGAAITPEAIIIGHDGKKLYAGRIDNFYAAVGKPRRHATTHDLRTALDETVAGKSVTAPKTDPVGCYIAPLSVMKSLR